MNLNSEFFKTKKIRGRNSETKSLLVSILMVGILVVFSICAFGQEGEAAHEEPAGIPRVVFYQALNFFALLVVLYFALRKKVGEFFKNRHDAVAAALREANRIKTEAENKHQEYVIKIQELKREQESVLAQIQHDGEETKKRILEEARRISENIKTEAKRAAENEIEKARAVLYDEVLSQALEGARTLLTKSVAENDQRRLQKEFVEKIEAVQ